MSIEKMIISTFLYYLKIYCELSSIFNPREFVDLQIMKIFKSSFPSVHVIK